MKTISRGPLRPHFAGAPRRLPVLIFLLFCTRAGAQSPDKDPAALFLLTDAAQRHGAPAGSLRTLEASGVFEHPDGRQVPFRVLADGLERLRWEFGQGRDLQVIVIRGAVGFRYEGGVRTAVAARESAGLRGELLPVLALGQWASSASQRVERAGAFSADVSRAPAGADQDSRQAMSEATRVRVVLDPEGGLALRVELALQSASGKTSLPMRIEFSEYQDTGGTLWPARATVFIDGAAAGSYLFKKALLNVPVKDSDFREPSE